MDDLWVKRTHSSSYFPPDFESQEKAALEALPGVHYLGTQDEVPAEGTLCLLTNTHTNLTPFLPVRDRVALILHPNSGHDNLNTDVAGFKAPCVLGNPIRAQAVAQWIMGALMQHFTAIVPQRVWPRSRSWDRPLLSEKSILIVGLGEVGRKVFRALEALGATPDVHDPFLGPQRPEGKIWDVVILAASLNPTSENFINEAFLKSVSKDFILLNPARGEMVDERALRAHFKKHPQGRAYLDVHRKEPYAPSFWLDCPQVVATPHIAGVWTGLTDAMIKFEEETLLLWRLMKREDFLSTHRTLLLSERRTAQGWYR